MLCKLLFWSIGFPTRPLHPLNTPANPNSDNNRSHRRLALLSSTRAMTWRWSIAGELEMFSTREALARNPRTAPSTWLRDARSALRRKRKAMQVVGGQFLKNFRQNSICCFLDRKGSNDFHAAAHFAQG